MKNITFIFALFLLLSGCSKETPNNSNGARTVTNTDFADPLLYIYMQNKYDTNKDYIFQPEEVMAIQSIDLSKQNNFESLKGLELFVNLEVLNLSGQKPQDRNLKLTNPKLWSLNCSDMNLLSIDVTALTELTEFNCSENILLNELNLSKNIKLKELNCDKVTYSGGVFKQLDLSNNRELETVICRHTSIENINFSNCKKLKYLDCSETSLKSIDLNDCTSLEYLKSSSFITILDIGNCPELKYLNIMYCDIKTLNIENNLLLEELIFNVAYMSSLDISKNQSLSKITMVNAGGNSKNPFIILYIKEGQTKPLITKPADVSYEYQNK